MKIERLGQDKIRIFLTFDDLLERGIQKEDMWREIPKVHELFSEMMDQAYSELGFDVYGPLAVEVFALPAQGMVVIVTRGKMTGHVEDAQSAEAEESEEELYDMEVTLEQSDNIMYMFRDFEDVIAAATQLESSKLTEEGRLYSYNGKWILAFEAALIEQPQQNALIAVLAEYGEATPITYAMLEEYGNAVMPSHAVKELCHHFK